MAFRRNPSVPRASADSGAPSSEAAQLKPARHGIGRRLFAGPPSRLRQSELADQLPRTELRQLDQIGTIVQIAEGDRIIERSTLGRECFIVVDGQFSVVGDSFAATVGSGQVAGELALLTGKRRNASVVAATDASVYALHPREFATLLSQAPTFRSRVIREASHRLGTQSVRLPAQFVKPPHRELID